LGSDTGAFWFFREDNLELVVKILDGCSVNGHYWVFIAGVTDLEVGIELRDFITGNRVDYSNPQGIPFETIVDVRALACSPTPP
jgi:hypothetical protein